MCECKGSASRRTDSIGVSVPVAIVVTNISDTIVVTCMATLVCEPVLLFANITPFSLPGK